MCLGTINLLSSPVQCGYFVWHWQHNSLLWVKGRHFIARTVLLRGPLSPTLPVSQLVSDSLPTMFIQGRGDVTALQEKLWLEQPHDSPSFSARDLYNHPQLFNPQLATAPSATASEQTFESLHQLGAGLEHLKWNLSSWPLHLQGIGWNKVKQNYLFHLKENKYS